MKVLGQDIMSIVLGLAGSIPGPFAFWSKAAKPSIVGGASKWLKSLGSFGFSSTEMVESLPPARAPKKGRNPEASLVGVPGLPGMKASGIRGRVRGMWAAASTGKVGLEGKETKYGCAGCAGSGKTGKGATAAGEPKLSAEVEATDEVEVVDEVDNSPELFAFFGR